MWLRKAGRERPCRARRSKIDDLGAALARVRAAGIAVEYGPVREPWGVRRFYVRDPFGRLVNNVLAHC
ncbi:hypothetical protein LMG23992_01197 [Cupriavidus laharis]|uniref:Glyoxalase/fosfomycin resistance/dioxygenase domain-containing protein n=1 Tax=Cupriavidus laharis TaxID=151654 RepID=A0ABN7Y5D9_9BURK|nr:hypothetical protein LMG23992_01197 [Cupriavidus laharis]